ncbi:Carbamoyl dehydratase HypE [bioreactor metagenome]|uniref:Carbamoyl dehydratase HypE n=1 Tax=bioreactor metagenome TaxID=1076179 RepID=A0A645IAW7_9ZZZZ
MRDPTRGGVGAVVQEMVSGSPAGAELREADLPVRPAFRALSGMLGIEPLFVACEGRLVLVAGPEGADAILDAWRKLPGGESACEIGELTNAPGRVTLRGEWGGRRLLVVPDGEQLPRIC